MDIGNASGLKTSGNKIIKLRFYEIILLEEFK